MRYARLKERLPAPVVEAVIRLRRADQRPPRHDLYVRAAEGRNGLEIGGPSGMFWTLLPLYQKVHALDGVNFSSRTLWEGSIESGRTFNYFRGRTGNQFICEATTLTPIAGESYDFIISSNCLEHVANPLRALLEWKRVLKRGGSLILALPNKVSNFDHRRPDTSFEHVLEDFEHGTTEDDLTHLDEILQLHDLSRDAPAGDANSFRARCLENHRNRGLHHHVFSAEVIHQMLEFSGFDVLDAATTPRDFYSLSRVV